MKLNIAIALLFDVCIKAQNLNECSSIITIVSSIEDKAASKASKLAKAPPNSSPVPSSNCSQIKSWKTGQVPRYETLMISSSTHNNSNPIYPVAIKLVDESSPDTAADTNDEIVLLSVSATGYPIRDRVNLIGAVRNETSYVKKSLVTLRKAQTHTFDDWQGTGKQLAVNARNITSDPNSSWNAVVELNFDNAVPNDSMTNLIICGYQGWFAYPGDGSPIDRWKHWFSEPQDPTVDNLTVEMYPSTDEYNEEDLMEANILMRDGSRAKFYSTTHPSVVRKHFEWMREYGISGVFHMRFMQDMDNRKTREWRTSVLRNVRVAAESTGRVFAVSYNIAGGGIDDSILDHLKRDWMELVDNEQVTQSERYLHHNGLPVLRIYGIGFKTVNVSDGYKMLELIRWLQSEADPKHRVFLIGGVPSRWRELVVDSRPEPVWRSVYESLSGLHPWHVGRWSTMSYFKWYYQNIIEKDAARCSELDILYMPTMFPGFSFHNLKKGNEPFNEIPRLGGRFLWTQAYSYIKNDKIPSIWMAQFDEVDEGTAIYKVASTQREVPAEGNWLTLDADGIELPNDWYLRLVGEAQKMMQGKIVLTDTIPIAPNQNALFE